MFSIPTSCPVCGGRVGVQHGTADVLVCLNPLCGAKLEGRVLQFIGPHGLDIESISTATVRDLIAWGWITEMSDIFHLKDHRAEWVTKNGYGESSVDKIIEGIPTSIELWRVIASAGIPNVEKHTAGLLAEKFQTWDDFRFAVKSRFDFTTMNGIGAVLSDAILNFDYSEIDKVMRYITIKKAVVGGKLAHMSFCITGKLSMLREDLIKIIEENGGKSASVGKGLTYLICNDKTSTSGKSKKAKDLGIPVITEDEFMKMI